MVILLANFPSAGDACNVFFLDANRGLAVAFSEPAAPCVFQPDYNQRLSNTLEPSISVACCTGLGCHVRIVHAHTWRGTQPEASCQAYEILDTLCYMGSERKSRLHVLVVFSL